MRFWSRAVKQAFKTFRRDVPIDVIHEEAGLCQGHGLREVGRLAAGSGWGCGGDAPVIHPAARGGPECRAGLGGSIKWAAVPCWRGQTFNTSSPEQRERGVRGAGHVQVVDGRSCRRLDGTRARRPRSLEAADLAVAQAVVAEGEHAPGERDLGDVPAAALGDPLECGAQCAAAGCGFLRGLDQRPADVRGALPRDVA